MRPDSLPTSEIHFNIIGGNSNGSGHWNTHLSFQHSFDFPSLSNVPHAAISEHQGTGGSGVRTRRSDPIQSRISFSRCLSPSLLSLDNHNKKDKDHKKGIQNVLHHVKQAIVTRIWVHLRKMTALVCPKLQQREA